MIVNGKKDLMKMPRAKVEVCDSSWVSCQAGRWFQNVCVSYVWVQNVCVSYVWVRWVRICKSKRAQRVAVNIAGGLKKVCLEVVANKGAASRG
jgi:hypothetical protein